MSDVWRICVVESDVSLNQNIVNSLRKDGYVVQGVTKSADAMRTLWSEEYHVVICDLKLPGAGGIELLRWLRAYRPNVRPLVLGDASGKGDNDQRLQALESGALCYIEKPVDLRLLKEELRRLLQQTGFTASLDSFDLLDVIQMITMSRKSITLHINTGLEEHGMLRFHNGDLAWAEYGVLRGEEAFFALAAHKNGTVTQQLSDEQSATNVTQPLSRLIFQALQYRSKYAHNQQPPGQGFGGADLAPAQSPQPNTPGNASSPVQFLPDEIDDSPFLFTSEEMLSPDQGLTQQMPQVAPTPSQELLSPIMPMDLRPLREVVNTSQSSPFWTTDELPRNQPSVPYTQAFPSETQGRRNSSPQWLQSEPLHQPSAPSTQAFPSETQGRRNSSPQWLQPEPQSRPSPPSTQAFPSETQERRNSSPQWPQLEPQRPSSSPQHRLPGQSGIFEQTQGRQNPSGALRENSSILSPTPLPTQRQVTRKNHAALVSALQTLGYSLPGFIAAAVADIDSQLIAQVVIDDADISQTWQLLSTAQRSVLNALQSLEWGRHEETIMTTVSRYVLMRAIASDPNVFLVLITTREANLTQSLETMTNVEGAITAALR